MIKGCRKKKEINKEISRNQRIYREYKEKTCVATTKGLVQRSWPLMMGQIGGGK